MPVFAIILALLALLLIVAASLWSLVLAFQRHILWGLAVLLLPFAGLIFLFVAWSEAKRPFVLSLCAIIPAAGAFLALPPQFLESGNPMQMIEVMRAQATPGRAAPSTPKPEPTLNERLANLRVREQTLRVRKTQLAAGDRAGTEALTKEIASYNVELQKVLALINQQPSASAAKPGQQTVKR